MTNSPTEATGETRAGTTETTRRSPTAWWRAKYSTMPPALQMIGLQLWLPVFFLFAFCFCYLGAFHSPQIHDAPVAVVNSPAASTFTDQFSKAQPGMFDFRLYQTADEATAAVRDGSAAASLSLPSQAGGKPVVTIASAHQYQAAQLMKGTFTQTFAQSGTAVQVNDIAPLPKSDAYGMGAMYLMLSWCIGGYMVAMFIGMMGAPLSHRTRVGILAGGALVASLITNLLASLVIGVYPAEHLPVMIGISFLWILAVGLAVNGLSYFFGRFITAVALLMFVFLSIPSSGAAYPTWMVPRIFGDLNPLVVGHGITEMIKRALYGVGEPYWQPFLLMGGYALLGIVTMIVGKRWRESKEFDRILAGKTTMMAAAQGAMMRKGMADRERILTAHGLDSNAEPISEADSDGDAPSNTAGVTDADDNGSSTAGQRQLVSAGQSAPTVGSHGNHSASAPQTDYHYTVEDLETSFSGDPLLNGNGLGGGFADEEREYEMREEIRHPRHQSPR